MEMLSRWFLGLTALAFVAILVRNASGADTVLTAGAKGVSTIYGTLIGGGPGGSIAPVTGMP